MAHQYGRDAAEAFDQCAKIISVVQRDLLGQRMPDPDRLLVEGEHDLRRAHRGINSRLGDLLP
jgi:hypothetical protein